jgi:hypothetical protein
MNACRAIAAFALSIVVGLQATSDRRREHAPLGIEVDVHIPQSGIRYRPRAQLRVMRHGP